jgi:hypothetical protein
MRSDGGVLARFVKSHFTVDALEDALAWSALAKVGFNEAHQRIHVTLLQH